MKWNDSVIGQILHFGPFLGLARSVCQVFKYNIYVCPLHPRSVACSFADLEGFTIPSSFPQTPPPFMHSSLHTSPSTPSVTSLTITGSSQLQNGSGLKLPKTIRQEYGVCTEIRRILPYIRRINTYIRKYRIRIRRGEAGNCGVYTLPYNTYNNTNTVLANPKSYCPTSTIHVRFRQGVRIGGIQGEIQYKTRRRQEARLAGCQTWGTSFYVFKRGSPCTSGARTIAQSLSLML